MSDPPKVIIKSKVSIIDVNDEDNQNNQSNHQPLPSSSEPQTSEKSLNRSASRNSENGKGGTSQSQRSSRRKRSSRKSNATDEEITLQETVPRNHPVTLKASFLRRKIKEYEGNNLITQIDYFLSAICPHSMRLPNLHIPNWFLTKL